MATAATPEHRTQVKPAHSHALFILLIAVIARVTLAAVYYHAQPPRPLTLNWDEDVVIALSIHSGHGFSSPFSFPSGPTAFLAPGYPYLIAGFVRALGTGAGAALGIVTFQMILSVLTVGLVILITRRSCGTRAANFAGLIAALVEPMLLMNMYIWDTCISALLLTAAIAVAPSISRKFHFAAAGAGCALAGLINPSLLPALFAILAWSAWRARVIPWLGFLTFLIVFSPWPIRNYVQMHAFIPLRSNAGYELWLGNHPGADGESPEQAGPAYHADERTQFLAEGEVSYMGQKTDLARVWITSHPARFIKLTSIRFLRFWSGSSKSPAPLTIPLALAGMAGLVLLWRSKSLFALFAIPLAIYPLPYYITHADARYQFIIDPLLAILAGCACECLLAFIDRRPLPAPATSPRQTPNPRSA